ncbi:2,3-bisphosphoglycerate-independent phosphoglycerate mutase [Thermoleophilum album]|uniref:2,3-bisphosphoglycerate-independent phosphoglycerate mutase n=1 Tax=Thermoleophilum album TaxID=29539 RepID=UPI00237CAE03|nr:2,3-bisphosphoglycerate-independent phosphoglycerate mutase [Thermoleophilum album]WDT94222.1 2,3-bisphosphoglycerate-independent phosphoglycerate mutase [Thermoleophilum album]
MSRRFERVCLVVLDGWGLAPAGPGNAIALARTPVFDRLWAELPHTQLTACGRAVGLPDGQMGNSEVGHLNLGAGRIVRQDLTRIDDAIADGSFFDNDVLRAACADARAGSGRLHLLGLVSDGGVHASMDHLQALLELAQRERVPDVCVHAFTDGRDTPPTSGAGHIETLARWVDELGGRVATISGRYYAMDRDRRWERTKKAYDAIVHGQAEGGHFDDPVAAVRAAYDAGETDEFITPRLVGAEGRVRPDDVVVFFNFRPDRARQLVRALAEPEFAEFERGSEAVRELVTLTRYQEEWDFPVAFLPEKPDVTLASVLADKGLRQLHAAETEKYPHVTYFFNGGVEDPYPGEERILIDSPRDVPTYDHKPEMSAPAVADAFCERWRTGDYAFGIVNFANPDMVGHTGVIEAAVRAVECVDRCLGQVVDTVRATGGACVVTADHGNADNMLEPDGSPNTAHSMNPVPFVIEPAVGALHADGGVLADVAPTVLALLGLDSPRAMTGKPLYER